MLETPGPVIDAGRSPIGEEEDSHLSDIIEDRQEARLG